MTRTVFGCPEAGRMRGRCAPRCSCERAAGTTRRLEKAVGHDGQRRRASRRGTRRQDLEHCRSGAVSDDRSWPHEGKDHARGEWRVRCFIHGQLSRQVTRLELTGPGLQRLLPRSAHRLFLAAFSSSATGVFTLRAYLADGSAFSHAFTLPLGHREAGPWPGLRRRGGALQRRHRGEHRDPVL